mmetsp:Transcript_20926/g.52881  ORF Transcript_20926/g.52881 Transcript_20926/m.52881 type:complete len:294 (+) Transcript_20926:152-1033(+)|eukprot:CAMPEP_0178998852 /NCGR_PEP_ID=MMETSP0795-20121207/9732_1 /TAXON_ID=88552 /ORGANISM="Amoebophrya sp., Strain Ameob2" /LENGTH=293 /DNA_ID=CAMNT_0020691555 /DNA_START=82 /DNA_END=963 /DNA_ORIENTATION=+
MSYTVQAYPHEAERMDRMLKERDGFYRSQNHRDSDAFSRTLPLANCHGSSRPSPAFTCEGRDRKQAPPMDMSNKPPLWYENYQGDRREGVHKLPGFHPINQDHLEIFNNFAIQLPSERRREHQRLKEGILHANKAKAELSAFKRQSKLVQRHHKNGLLGIDAPTRPDTELYRERYDMYKAQEEASHAPQRAEFLREKNKTNDAIANPVHDNVRNELGRFPAAQPRSHDIPIQRKDVDSVRHPYRFFDTHYRLFDSSDQGREVTRAKALRTHEMREKHYDILNFADNKLDLRVA